MRWLRPDYQKPKLGHKVKAPDDVEQVEAHLVVPAPADGKPAWPKDEMDRIRAVRGHAAPRPWPGGAGDPEHRIQGQGSTAPRAKGVEKVLQTLVAAGVAQQGVEGEDGSSRFFIPR